MQIFTLVSVRQRKFGSAHYHCFHPRLLLTTLLGTVVSRRQCSHSVKRTSCLGAAEWKFPVKHRMNSNNSRLILKARCVFHLIWSKKIKFSFSWNNTLNVTIKIKTEIYTLFLVTLCPIKEHKFTASDLEVDVSRVRGSVTNNNGFWIGWLDLLQTSLQLFLTAINYNSSQTMAVFKTRSILTGLRVSSLLLWLTWFWFTSRSLLQLPLSAG
jgi:hypothetical protein